MGSNPTGSALGNSAFSLIPFSKFDPRSSVRRFWGDSARNAGAVGLPVGESLAASEAEHEDGIGKVKAQASVGRLKLLVPWMGLLYGELSATTHAGLPQHRRAFKARDGMRSAVILAWSRLGTSAAHLLMLADAWVVVWEHTQRLHMKSFVSLASVDD
ncbi:MAG: hypothetical protein ABIO33_04690, partial [Leifsonia sp.]